MPRESSEDKARFNIVTRLAHRHIYGYPPGSQVACNRRFYENLVINDKKQVDIPDFHICKFLPSGRLVGIAAMQKALRILSFSGIPNGRLRSGPDSSSRPSSQDPEPLPFNRLFDMDLEINLSMGEEYLCKDFCLVAHQERFLIVASCSPPRTPQPSPGQSINVPRVTSTTFYVVDSLDGTLCDTYRIADDFIQLSHAHHVFILDDTICILAIRSQTIHILHIDRLGQLHVAHRIGAQCRDDDDYVLASQAHAQRVWLQEQEVKAPGSQGSAVVHRPHQPPLSRPASMQAAGHPWLDRPAVAPPQASRAEFSEGMIVGLPQKLLTNLYLHHIPEKEFYSHFNELLGLIMWKVQFLTKVHLLVSMGPQDAWLQRDTASSGPQPYCLFLWCIAQGKILKLWHFDSLQLLETFQSKWQFFHVGCIATPWHQYLTPTSACTAPCSTGSSPSLVRKILSNLPTTSQSQCPSPYLDNRLFCFDDRLLNALIRPRQFTETPIKFSVRDHRNAPGFKLSPETDPGLIGLEGPENYIVNYHVSPVLPLVLCVLQKLNGPAKLTVFHRSP